MPREFEKPALETSSLWRRRATAIAGLVLLPVGAVLLYLMLGSPQLPGEPLAARLQAPNENRSVENMVAQVENHLARNPNDGRAWEVLAPVYMRLGRFDDAVRAWRNALSLNGSSAAREADLGEALVFAANGVVTAEAKSQFERAFALDGAGRDGALLPWHGGRSGRPARRRRKDLARPAGQGAAGRALGGDGPPRDGADGAGRRGAAAAAPGRGPAGCGEARPSTMSAPWWSGSPIG